LLKDAAHATSRIVGLVVIILFCSSFFSLVFDGLGGKGYITNMLVNLPGGVIGYMIVANIAIFLLGVFLEFTEICYIAMPLLTPAASVLGIDLVWFSIVMAINLQTAFISPPVGFSLFYMQSVVPKEISTIQIHKSAIPFLVLQVIVLAVVIAFPQTVRWLVDISFK
jgi:TRAP-type mannitol/chloroaromatic compound transport system permease large subunit